MNTTKIPGRPAIAAASVAAVLAGGAFLLPSLSDETETPPRPAAATADPVIQTNITETTAKKLDNLGFDFNQDLQTSEVAVTRDEALKSAQAEFGPMAGETPPTIAALGTFTNGTYGRTLEDGTVDPFIVNRATWMIVYEGVPQTAEGLLPPRGAEIVTPKVPGSADIAVFVDAQTGEVLGANTLASPEEKSSVGGPGK